MSQPPQQVLLPLNYPPFAAKLKVIIKMLLKRVSLRLKQEEQTAKQSQREIAQLLLERNKEQKAYYKAEAMIMDDCTVQMLEILENYSEMLLVRIPILNNTISGEKELKESESLDKGIRTLLLASLHFPEFKELVQFKELMVLKFGRSFVESTMYKTKVHDGEEPDDDKDLKIFDEKFFKLSQRNIAEEAIVESYLKEIAMAYNAPYSKLPAQEKEDPIEEEPTKEPLASPSPAKSTNTMTDLEKRFSLLKQKK